MGDWSPTASPAGCPAYLAGAVALTRYVGGTSVGAPTTGTFAVGDFVIDQLGDIWICITGGSPGTWRAGNSVRVDPAAQMLGYKGWNFPPNACSSSAFATSQLILCQAVYLPAGITITGLSMAVSVPGTGAQPTGFFVGIASSSKMLAQSGNLNASAALTTASTAQFAFTGTYTTNYTDSANGLYYAVELMNGAFGGTNVSFGRNSGVAGTALSGFAVQWGSAGAGQTALPANGAAFTPAPSGGTGFHAGFY